MGVALETLCQPPFALIAKRHAEFPNLVLLKYNQIESDMDNPLVCQCRGVILDEADNWAIVSRPFDKFWNAHEGRAATIDWTTARVQEKLDGSLIQMYWYRGLWRVGTSGTPDATGRVNGFNLTFQELFWEAFEEMRFDVPPAENARSVTFLFELMSPYNRVVTKQSGHTLRLIGLRERTGKEYPTRSYAGYNPVHEFALTTPSEIEDTFLHMDPLDQEGYVIVDAAFNRIKVKHPGYVALHHLRDNLTPKGILDVVRKGETGEVLASFPEWKDEFARVQRAYDWLVERITLRWRMAQGQPTQKDFAIAVKDFPYSGVLFALRKGTVQSVKEALVDARLDRLMEWTTGGQNGDSEASSAGPESDGTHGGGVSQDGNHSVGERSYREHERSGVTLQASSRDRIPRTSRTASSWI